MNPTERAGDLFMRAHQLAEDDQANRAVPLLEEALDLVDPHHDPSTSADQKRAALRQMLEDSRYPLLL